MCCLPDRLEAAIVAVADVVGMEGLSATELSVAGAAPELSDCASEPYNEWSDASPVTALTAVTKSSCRGFDKQVQSAEGSWLSSDAKLACTYRIACLAMSTGMSTSSAHKHVAEDTAVSGKSGGTNKGTAGSMGVSPAEAQRQGRGLVFII